MNPFVIARYFVVSSAYLLAATPVAALAQMSASSGATAVSAEMVASSPPRTASVSQRLVSSFAVFAGSEENAASLVNGLHAGSPVTLATTPLSGGASGGSTASGSLTFTPPTSPMGWGNVEHALTLAQQELAARGIANPTPAQLQAALTGGTVTAAAGQTVPLSGVLALRQQGMGWGQIAQKLGTSMGSTESIDASSHGTAAVTAQESRIDAANNSRGDLLRSSNSGGEGSGQVRIGSASTAWSSAGQTLPAASTPVAAGLGLGIAASHGGLGHGSPGRGR